MSERDTRVATFLDAIVALSEATGCWIAVVPPGDVGPFVCVDPDEPARERLRDDILEAIPIDQEEV